MNMSFVFRVHDDFRTYSCVVWLVKCPTLYILHHINNKIYVSVSDCQRINIEFPLDTGSRDIQCENRTVITITNITVTGKNNVMICLQPSNLVIFIHTFPRASVVRHHMFDIVDFCLNVKWAVFHQYSWHVRFLTDVWLPQRKEKRGGGWFKCGQGLNILLCNDHSKCCSFWFVVSRR